MTAHTFPPFIKSECTLLNFIVSDLSIFSEVVLKSSVFLTLCIKVEKCICTLFFFSWVDKPISYLIRILVWLIPRGNSLASQGFGLRVAYDFCLVSLNSVYNFRVKVHQRVIYKWRIKQNFIVIWLVYIWSHCPLVCLYFLITHLFPSI